MKKSIVFLILATLFTFLFVSCNAKEENFSVEYDYHAEKLDFNGVDFDFLINSTYYSSEEFVLGYIQDTLFADLVKTRIAEVEEEMNIKINLINTSAYISSTVQTEAFIGYSSYAATQSWSGDLANGVRAGLFIDYSQFSEYLDYRDTKKWGDPEHLKPLMWNGGIYGVFPNLYPMLKYDSTQGLMVVNEQLIKSLNQADPREFVENGTWTWRKFEELMPVYAHVDASGKEVAALHSTIHWLFRTIQTTNGGNVLYKDNLGEWQLSLYTNDTYEALATGYSWAFGEFSSYVFIEPGNYWQNILPGFINGDSVTAILDSSDIYATSNSVAYNMTDFGILNFPVGPNGSRTTPGSTITDLSYVITIPALFAEPEMSCIVINRLFDALPGYETDQDSIDYLMQYYFYDSRDVDNFINAYINILYDYRNEGLTDVVISINESRSLSEWLESAEAANENNRVRYAVNIETTIEELYQ